LQARFRHYPDGLGDGGYHEMIGEQAPLSAEQDGALWLTNMARNPIG
jgi:hypothetical protein